jgi:hypothetical protein
VRLLLVEQPCLMGFIFGERFSDCVSACGLDEESSASAMVVNDPTLKGRIGHLYPDGPASAPHRLFLHLVLSDMAVPMRSVFCCSLLISFGMATPAPAASTFAYTTSGTCIASPEGFNSKLEPVNSGVAWTTTFNAAGSADASGNVTEVGQSVDSASFGVGPRMHQPAVHAYQDTFASTVTGSDGDGSFTLHVGTLSGTFTAGPNAGVTFITSGFELKKLISDNGFTVFGSVGSPTTQTVSLANGIKFKRICMLTASISPRR